MKPTSRYHTIFPGIIYLPHPPELTGTDAFQLLEHAAEVVQLSDTTFQTDLLDTLVRKPQHPFRMGDSYLLHVSDQRHPVLLFEQPSQIVLVNE